MTPWTTCCEIISGILPMWRACRTVDGVVETDLLIFGTHGEAITRMHELNTKEKAPEAAATDKGRREIRFST